MAKISIILPCFNVEKFLARALDSCIHQTCKDIEIIIVDDGSTDLSLEIAKGYADARIKIIQNEKNLGTFATRNKGALSASGEYLLFLDPDDYLSLDICEIALENIGDCHVLGFGMKVVGQNLLLPQYRDYDELRFLMRELTWIRWNLCGNLILRSHYLACCAHFEPVRILMAEDLLVFAHLITPKMRAINHIGYYYELQENSIMKKDGKHSDAYCLVSKLLRSSNLNSEVIEYFNYFLASESLARIRRYKKQNYLMYRWMKMRLKFLKFKVRLKLRFKSLLRERRSATPSS